MTKTRIDLGSKAEDAATAFLKQKGYQIVERNVKTLFGEIDIIAKEKGTICFVEVRSRSSTGIIHPFESITHAKRQKLRHLALGYLQEHELLNADARFDVVAVIPKENGQFEIELIKDAFSMS